MEMEGWMGPGLQLSTLSIGAKPANLCVFSVY